MEIKREGMPEEGDIIIATVTRVAPHAAFITLDNYEGVEGLIHISEVSKSWVKNLKTHFRDNQKVVCKVLEVKGPGFVHCSIRRVNDHDRRAKWDQVKQQHRVENIIERLARTTKNKPEEVYKMLKPLEAEYGDLYYAFEEVKKAGKAKVRGIPIADELWKAIDRRISIPTVEIVGTLKLGSTAGDGVERIKKMLKGVKADVTYLGAPNYRIAVEATDYKEAEKELGKLIKSVQKKAGPTESVTFEREKR
jgi:translation initiation factor 2 subunit 1